MSTNKWKRPGRYESNACVEIRNGSDEGTPTVLIRSSDSPGRMLRFTREEWDVFVAGVKAGDFDD